MILATIIPYHTVHLYSHVWTIYKDMQLCMLIHARLLLGLTINLPLPVYQNLLASLS